MYFNYYFVLILLLCIFIIIMHICYFVFLSLLCICIMYKLYANKELLLSKLITKVLLPT